VKRMRPSASTDDDGVVRLIDDGLETRRMVGEVGLEAHGLRDVVEHAHRADDGVAVDERHDVRGEPLPASGAVST